MLSYHVLHHKRFSCTDSSKFRIKYFIPLVGSNALQTESGKNMPDALMTGCRKKHRDKKIEKS
jgi:hypothetical protein